MRWAKGTKVDALLALAVVLMIAGPLLFTDSGFAEDFTNALWLAWVAGKNLVQSGHPSFFVNTTTLGLFYPLFAFYGGPLYTATGALSELVGGHAIVAFAVATMLAILGVYGGILWLARQFGLRGLAAHAPALTAVTSAYYVTDLYGRGDWTEFMVSSALAPLVASGVCLLRAERWRLFPTVVFVASTMLFTAGHNITLLWAPTIGLAALLIVWLLQGAPRRLPYRRLAMLCGLGLVSASINAWYLLPDAFYASKVAIGHSAPTPETIWDHTREFNLVSVVLDPFRRVPRESSTPALYVQAPDWFIAWGLVASVFLLWRGGLTRALRRACIAALVLLGLLLGLLLIKPVWQFVRPPFNEIQAPYRLSTYIFYATAGLVLVAALGVQRVAEQGGSTRAVRNLRIGLVGAMVVSLALCIWQLWVPNTLYAWSYKDRSRALASASTMPASWYAVGDYYEWTARIVSVPQGRVLYIPPSTVPGDRLDAWLNVPPGPQPILTNIIGTSFLLRLDGLRIVGRNNEDYAVVKRVNNGSGRVHVVVETAETSTVQLGRILSRVGLLATIALLGFVGLRTLRVRRRLRTAVRVPG